MPDKCIECSNARMNCGSLFSFPKDIEKARKWLQILEKDTIHYTSQISKLLICPNHFEPHMLSRSTRPRPLPHALPHKTPSEEPAQPVLVSKGVQVDVKSQLIKKLEAQNRKLKSRLKELETNPKPSFLLKHLDKLQSFLPEDQWELLSSNLKNAPGAKTGRRYDDKIKKMGSQLYFKNPAAYKNSASLGLPSKWTIARYNQHKVSRTGWSPTLESLLKSQAAELSDTEKVCVLSFDETEITPQYSYNKTLDTVDGFVDLGHLGRETAEARKVLVFILRGVHQKFKQAVSYYLTGKSLDSVKLKSLLEYNVQKCIEIGFDVVAVITDGDGKNRKLSNDLKCTIEHPDFILCGRRMVFMFDVPHIWKLIRNQLVERDIRITIDGHSGEISWDPIVEHLEPMTRAASIMSTCPRIRKQHLDPQGYDKMKVRLATQIFSHSVSASMKHAINSGKLKHDKALLTAKFLAGADVAFDLLNSSTNENNKKPWNRALKRDDENFDLLRRFLTILESISFCEKKDGSANAKVYCIDMLKQTINAIIIVSNICFDKGIEHVKTRRFQTDACEHYFSQVKSKFRVITAKSFQSFFRSSMILKSFEVRGSNCEPELDEEPLLADDASYIGSLFSPESNSSAEETDILHFLNDFHKDLTTLPEFNSEGTSTEVYYAGYILRRLEKDAIGCSECIERLTSPDLLGIHAFVKLKEYSEEGSSLKYCSVKFLEWIKEVIEKLEQRIPNAIFMDRTKLRLLNGFENFKIEFLPCHSEEIKMQVLKYTINTMLEKHLKDLRVKQVADKQAFDLKSRSRIKRKSSTRNSIHRKKQC